MTRQRPADVRPTGGPAALRVRVLRTAAEVDACAEGWERTIPPDGLGPLVRPAWVTAAAATLAPPGRLRVVVVEEAGTVIAAAPLVEGPADRLELLGAAELPEPGDFVARDAAALHALAHGVIALRRPVRLPRVPAGSPTPAALRHASGYRGWVVTRPADPWPTLWLDSAWTAAEGRLSGRRAADLRRAHRRAEAQGTVAYAHHRPRPAEVDALLAQALAVEAGGWKGRARTALLHDPLRRGFFTAWSRRAAADGSLRISFLAIDGTPVAVQVAAETAGRRWILKIGHTDAHARCSPGLLLLLETVRRAAQQGLDTVELLGTIEPWTRAWTDHASDALLVRLYPTTRAGLRRLTVDGRRAVAARAARFTLPTAPPDRFPGTPA